MGLSAVPRDGPATKTRAKDVRSCELELPPECILQTALPFGYRCEHRKIARSARSGRVMTSSMPLRMTGRAAANSDFPTNWRFVARRKWLALRRELSNNSFDSPSSEFRGSEQCNLSGSVFDGVFWLCIWAGSARGG